MGDEPKNLSSLTRGLPSRTYKSAVVGKDQAVGDVMRRRTRLKRIINGKEAAEPQLPIVRHDVSALEYGAGSARKNVHAGASCDPQSIRLIARYRDGRNGQFGAVSNAKPQPVATSIINEMPASSCPNFG